MPELNTRSYVHGEGGTEDLGKSGPHAPAVVWSGISGACRIGSPVVRCAGLELFLVCVAEIGVGLVGDVVVDTNVVFVRVCGCGSRSEERRVGKECRSRWS